ncbi:S-layer homology domain-containing protein [Candidatus Peregrinibacteria bacterium]|nr:S-layer homology domain-containing protein [Candidatus Peregrinibacteria bacterium]
MLRKKTNKYQKKIEQILKRFSPRTAKILKITGLAVITLALMALVYTGEQAGIWFKASVLEAPQPFSGTVMPVAKVPNWTHWNTQNNLRYDQIPENELIDLPAYDLSKMQFPDDQLVWGDSSQDSIRNVKIVYPVVYMGDYKYDHVENAGSHPAVDIKMPVGTPIHAIANGKVVKTSVQSTGFGHHIVIQHPNVPDPENPGTLTTLYSAYNHLDRVDVAEGQNVLKGQIVGTSGNTGTSTTPHLHFQIDREEAPWHPYWPFSWAESQAAGLSFFEAVNAGLGLGQGRDNTVNPMAFVSRNLSYSQVASNNNTGTQDTTNNPVVDPVEDPIVNPIAEPEPAPEPEPQPTFNEGSPSALFTYTITGETVSLIGNGVTLIVTDTGNQVAGLSDNDQIQAEVNGVGNLLKKQFTRSDFVNNTLKLIVKSDTPGTANVMIGKSAYQVTFISELKGVAKFHIEHDGYYQKNIVETVKVVALDEDGNVAPTLNFTGTVKVSVTDGLARVIPDELTKDDFKNGVADVRVIVSNNDPVVLRAQNGALVGVSESMHIEDSAVFADVNNRHPNYEAIKYLKEHNVIGGYSDGTFKPDKTVNRAEALKMLMTAFNVGVGGYSDFDFTDTDKNAWYAASLGSAVAKGIVKGYSDGSFKPANTVNRAEYLKILFKTVSMEPNSEITQPYSDVSLDQWFAGYAFLANKLNLLQPASNFNPANGMTRAGVAETIYRMKMIQDYDWVAYLN